MATFEGVTREELHRAGLPENPLDFEEGFQAEIRKRADKRRRNERVLRIRRDYTLPEIEYPEECPVKNWEDVFDLSEVDAGQREKALARIRNWYEGYLHESKSKQRIDYLLSKKKSSKTSFRVRRVESEYGRSSYRLGVPDNDSAEDSSQERVHYLLGVLYESGIEVDDWFVKNDVQKIYNVPLFVRMIGRIRKEVSVQRMDSGEIMDCYRAVEANGEDFIEQILSGRDALENLLLNPFVRRAIREEYRGPVRLTMYLSSDPYLCESLKDIDMQQAELSAQILQKIGEMKGQGDYYSTMNLDAFVYFTRLVSRYKDEVRNLEWREGFLEKNNLLYRDPFEILLYRVRGIQLPISQEEGNKMTISKELTQEYFRERYPFVAEIENIFKIPSELIPVGANNDFSGTQRNIASLRFLYEHPDLQGVIADTFLVRDLKDLIQFIHTILSQRDADPVFPEKMEAVSFLYRAIRGSEFQGIEEIDLLYRGSNGEIDPVFVRWLAVLHKETGVGVIDELRKQNTEWCVRNWRKWYEHPDDFRLAESMGIFQDEGKDQSREYLSGVCPYENFSEIVRDKNLLGFLEENRDMSLLKKCLRESALLEVIKKWAQDPDVFYKAKKQGLFLSENQFPNMAHNFHRYETISFLLRSSDFLAFVEDYPDTSLQKEFLMKDCEKNTGFDCTSLRSWMGDRTTFSKVKLLGLGEYELERSLLEYSRFACLTHMEDAKILGVANFLRNASWGRQRWILDNLERFADIEDDKKELYLQILDQLDASPSREIQRIKNELIPQLLQVDDPEEKYKKIEDIFVRNNLPLVGKVFRIFQVLHPVERLDEKLKNDRLSPCLRSAGSRRRYAMVYEDLLKVHIESGNRNLREYLEVLADGEAVLHKIEDGSDLSLQDQERLDYFMSRLQTLFSASQLGGRSESFAVLEGGDDPFSVLRRSLRVREGQSITERLAEMFLKPLGYTSFEQVLQRMREKKQEAHQRGLAFCQDILESELVLREGDFIKGVGFSYMGNILQNGSVAQEYLGESSSSDQTPFDTDLARVMRSGSVRETLNTSMASDYGEVLFLVKDRGQFQKTTKGDPDRYDPTKLELFETYHGEHWGIRTGFPSTEIDAILVKDSFLQDKQKMNALGIDIAQNGVYIPVVGEDGQVALSPGEFDRYREGIFDIDSVQLDSIREELTQVMRNVQHTPKAVMDVFGLGSIWRSDVGVAEGYTLGQHTEMMMRQFWKYFRRSFPEEGGMSRNLMEVALALHDIGKPQAVLTGDKGRQHKYTKDVLRSLLPKMGYPLAQVDAVVALIDGDPIGEYLQGKNVESARVEILSMAKMSGLATDYFLRILEILYKVDAGSYTVDAGGQASLDSIFIFQPEIGAMRFSQQYEEKMEILRRKVLSESTQLV